MKERSLHIRLLALCTWLILCGGCQRAVYPEQGPREMELGEDHVLHGKVYDVGNDGFTTPSELFIKLERAHYLLLGEKHDNSEHHRLHARVIKALPKPKAILLEMISLDKRDRINKTLNESEFRDASDWDKSGWAKYKIYRPKIRAIYDQQLQPGAAQPSRISIFKAMKASSDDANEALTPIESQSLSRAVDRAHCGHLDAEMVEMMARAQMFKDSTMAYELTRQTGGGRGVLIAGNGHVRSDYGVPKYLKNSVSLAFIEVQAETLKASDYEIEHYDYVWFTARVDNEDPCKKFEAQLRQIKKLPRRK